MAWLGGAHYYATGGLPVNRWASLRFFRGAALRGNGEGMFNLAATVGNVRREVRQRLAARRGVPRRRGADLLLWWRRDGNMTSLSDHFKRGRGGDGTQRRARLSGGLASPAAHASDSWLRNKVAGMQAMAGDWAENAAPVKFGQQSAGDGGASGRNGRHDLWEEDDQPLYWFERAAAEGFGPAAQGLAQAYLKGVAPGGSEDGDGSADEEVGQEDGQFDDDG